MQDLKVIIAECTYGQEIFFNPFVSKVSFFVMDITPGDLTPDSPALFVRLRSQALGAISKSSFVKIPAPEPTILLSMRKVTDKGNVTPFAIASGFPAMNGKGGKDNT